jgi:hypothetical protein
MSDDAEQVVMADAQFTVTRLLRPIENFTEVYQGQDARRPIMWTEQSRDRDKLSEKGEAGYDSHLLAALSVPFGSRVVIKFPSAVWIDDQPTSEGVLRPYVWDLTWRVRSVRDARLLRSQYHMPKQGSGSPDTSVFPPEPRIYLPASMQTVTYNQPEPANPLARVIQNIHPESYRIGRAGDQLQFRPFLKDGSEGIYEQGVIDPAVSPLLVGLPSYMDVEVQALGDELMIGMRRETELPLWDFTNVASTDGLLAKITNDAKDSGILVMTGTAP